MVTKGTKLNSPTFMPKSNLLKLAKNVLERRVIHGLHNLPHAEVGRNYSGLLWFKWQAPCAELEALWLSVSSYEIILSCKRGHRHFSKSTYLPEKLTKRRMKHRIARDACAEVRRFIAGEIVIADEIREDGMLGTSIWCRTNQAISNSNYLLGDKQ